MAKRIPILLALSFLFLAAELANAQHVYTASSRLIRAQEALTPKAKSLTYYTHSDMNVVTNAYGGNLGNTVAHSLIRNSMHLDYSFTNNILFALNALVYQDIHHRDKASNFFENITLATKIGGFSFANDHIYAGGMLTFMIPLAGEQYYNAYGVPYSAGGTETSFNVLLSYYADNLFPKESFNANLNLGFYGYFDDGKNISNNSRPLRVIGNSSSLNYSLSLKYPTAVVDLMLEFWGWAWITQPALQAYSRESMSFLSLGARIKPVDYLSVLLGYDYQLSGKTDETTYDGLFDIVPRPGGGKATNYTEWRFILGIQVNILPLSFGSTTADPRSVDFSAESQGADVIIRKLEDIGEDKEITSRKIQEIQRRRQDIDKNLQQLRQILKISEPAPTSSAMPTPAPSPAPTVAPAPAPAPAQEPPKEEPKKEEETPKKKPVRKRK